MTLDKQAVLSYICRRNYKINVMAKIKVQDTEVTVVKVNNEDYFCLTDMIKAKDGDFFITDWLRNRNTLEYLGIWERVYNPCFNYGEFALIKSRSGLNSFKISVKEFVARTNAVGLQAKAGRYGGTYAHKDIAFEFAMWISPEFKIYIVKEFQRLKEAEQKQLGWSVKRELAKINYRIHTSAIKQHLIPDELTFEQKSYVYADEADLLNMAMFGMTANQWREANPGLKGNIRDYAVLPAALVSPLSLVRKCAPFRERSARNLQRTGTSNVLVDNTIIFVK